LITAGKTIDGEKITTIRPAFGCVRHIKVEGEVYYREAKRDWVVFEGPRDEEAWDLCGPQPRQVPIDLR
jgi:hypothetical protein